MNTQRASKGDGKENKDILAILKTFTAHLFDPVPQKEL